MTRALSEYGSPGDSEACRRTPDRLALWQIEKQTNRQLNRTASTRNGAPHHRPGTRDAGATGRGRPDRAAGRPGHVTGSHDPAGGPGLSASEPVAALT